jgi:hypothetical protein
MVPKLVIYAFGGVFLTAFSAFAQEETGEEEGPELVCFQECCVVQMQLVCPPAPTPPPSWGPVMAESPTIERLVIDELMGTFYENLDPGWRQQ